MAGCGADLEANALLTSLTADVDFTIPDVDLSGPEFEIPGGADGPLYQEVKPLTEADLTSRTVGGNGLFDGLMKAFSAHIIDEYEKNRIAGAEYTKAYIAVAESALGNAVNYLLGKDQAFWAAQQAQVQAITARVQLETAKVQLVAIQLEARNQEANYALTKMRLASESAQYCISQFQLSTMLPQENLKLIAETEGQVKQNDALQFNVQYMLPEQLALTTVQKEGANIANTTADYNLSTLLPQQFINLVQQKQLLSEQTEAQRAQTTDGRSDGLPVEGLVGQQKALYAQQIISYKRDSEVKASKPFTDAWITMKTIDEGTLPPNGFTNASIDEVLTALKTNNNLD